MKSPVGLILSLLATMYIISTLHSGCAQIGMPTGGPKDTLAPTVVSSTPANYATNFTGRTIRFSFDEYIELKDAFTNVILNPTPARNITVTHNRSSMTVRLRDSLTPNTTYSISFGNAITDFNENNVLKDFTYVFSTGDQIDSFSITGNVLLAETGLADSTLLVLLYKNLEDSAVRTQKPNYITRVSGNGSFAFNFLPEGQFRIYALKDADGGKTYNQKSEMFAFTNEAVFSSYVPGEITLFAYQEEKVAEQPTRTTTKEKDWKLQTNLSSGRLDLLQTLLLDYTRSIALDDNSILLLLDSSQNNVVIKYAPDSTETRINVEFDKTPGMEYALIIPENFAKDSLGNSLPADTLRFITYSRKDYGDVTLRFNNLDLSKSPVIQFVQNNNVVFSAPIQQSQWRDELFRPGTYDIRILYDENKNGVWDRGNFALKQQPEKAITLDLKISVKAGWETEQDINL